MAGAKIDEVFIGSCMTNIGHFRAASKLLEGKRDIPVKLWVAPPTKMDAQQLTEEGHYGVFGTAGARTEMPGCSLCMGNQAQVREGATVMSTSHPQLPEPPGQEHQRVPRPRPNWRRSARKLGRIPTKEEYMADMGVLNADGDKIYQYMNFDKIDEFKEDRRRRSLPERPVAPDAESPRSAGLFSWAAVLRRRSSFLCSPMSVGGLPVTAALAILNSCIILLSSTSQYSALTMRTASRPRFGSVGAARETRPWPWC